ncbi:MAG TPA: hypothetical protein VJ486_14060 [Geothrix sp.]|nr:hypothetical protein [Geothrix sp.]
MAENLLPMEELDGCVRSPASGATSARSAWADSLTSEAVGLTGVTGGLGAGATGCELTP